MGSSRVQCAESAEIVVSGNEPFQPRSAKDKKTRLIYLGDKKVGRARQYSKNYKKLVQIVEKMSMLNMEILKNSES